MKKYRVIWALILCVFLFLWAQGSLYLIALGDDPNKNVWLLYIAFVGIPALLSLFLLIFLSFRWWQALLIVVIVASLPVGVAFARSMYAYDTLKSQQDAQLQAACARGNQGLPPGAADEWLKENCPQ